MAEPGQWSVGVSLAPDKAESALALVQVAPPCCGLLWHTAWRDGPRGLLPRLPTLGPGASTLVVDVTATGGAGLPPLRRARFTPRGVMLHSGHAIERAQGLTWLPYLRLLAPLRRALQEFRLPLVVEDAAWRDEVDAALVMALAVAVWATEAAPRPVVTLAGRTVSCGKGSTARACIRHET